MESEDQVQLVYDSKNNEELSKNYDLWASEYDKDLDDKYGYLAPQPAIEVLLKYLPKTGMILDAGVGTGIIGDLMSQAGYQNLEGVDLSPGMLQEAKKKGKYKALYNMVLGGLLDLETNAFDAIISVGTFTFNHAPSSSFDELIRITKPGGYIIFVLRMDFYEQSDFQSKMTALEEAGQWKCIEVTEPSRCFAKTEPDVYVKAWVYQVE